MKLKDQTSIFNMGDTSIRVKQLVEVNQVILRQLDEYIVTIKSWEKNANAQEEFYRSFIEEIARVENEEDINLFRDFARLRNYTFPKPGKVGLRGRTLTNSLVKCGLINSKRELSEVGKHYISDKIAQEDNIEKLLGLSMDNIVYLRQYLKLRIYSVGNSNQYFYNFRFALKFLAKYDDVPQNDFLKIIESIKPDFPIEKIEQIIENYKNVSANNELFDEYYTNTFSSTLRSDEELQEAKKMFKSKSFTDENFIRFFPNRDSNDISLLYKQFVLNLIDLMNNEDPVAFSNIKNLSRDDKIKKAFGGGKIPFSFKRKETLNEFLKSNEENPLLNKNHYHIYLEFIFSKHNDLIREYSDMCRRAFQVTGLISFENGLVNLNNKWIIELLLKSLGSNFKLNGIADYDEYENSDDSIWFKDISSTQILNISPDVIESLLNNIAKQFEITDLSNISRLINNKREQEYRDFIDSHFSKEKTIKILSNIVAKEYDEVFKLVTDNATIPTIFEYILTISWYHISEKKDFSLHQSFQVSLDGNRLPLTHRGGGAGDIEIISQRYALLIEATLMDTNTQKRGELEPVIRHTTNFVLQNSKKQSQSIFIANELDDNVLNIFRATQFTELNGTIETGHVDGLNIFAFTTEEIIRLLNEEKTDELVLQTIIENSQSKPTSVKTGWRMQIVNKIFK
jgi:hypothetical protein